MFEYEGCERSSYRGCGVRRAISDVAGQRRERYGANPRGGDVLPVVPSDQGEIGPAPRQGDPDARPLPKILIIDDSESTALALAALLRRASYDTALALRGAEGLDRARSELQAGG